jgi:transposase
MARSYRLVDRAQEFLLPPSMVDWLAEDHLVWFVIAAVERLDTSRFHERAKLGGVGRKGYDPDMLLTLFVYAMAHGESSSRQIERLCHSDVAFRIICASDVPDHTVLARFRQRHERALTDLLTESLVLAAELGMVSLGVVAFDGTRIAANASRDANRTEGHLRKLAEGFVATVAETDEAEDAVFGEESRGDELPVQVRDRTGRGERIAAALAQIEARRRAAEQAERERSEADRVAGRAYEQAIQRAADGGSAAPLGPPPKGADPVVVARARLERERARVRARQAQQQARIDQARAEGRTSYRGRRRRVPPVEDYLRVREARARYEAALAEAEAAAAAAAGNGNGNGNGNDGPGGSPDGDETGPSGRTGEADNTDQTTGLRANTTDPESRLLKTRNGWIQGYNCQTAVSDDAFIVSARATQDANDMAQFEPTMQDITATAGRLAERTGRDDLTIGVMLGDAGYDSDDNLTAKGPDRLIADAKAHTIDQRATTNPATGDPGDDASAREQMNHRLRTPEGHALYKRRSPIVEPPNGWLKDRRGLRRFARRGLTAAQAELSLACTVTNLLKLRTKGITTHQLQTG